MSREVSLLSGCKPVTRETFRVLQVEDVFPDFLAGNISQKFTILVAAKVSEKIVNASDHDLDSISAVAFGGGTELVAGNKVFGINSVGSSHLASPQIFGEASTLEDTVAIILTW